MKHNSLPSERLSITPLIDIAFLVLIFFMSLPFKQLDQKLSAHLPTDGCIPTVQEPRYVVSIRVRKDSYEVGDRRRESAWALAPTLRLLGKDSTYSIRGDPGVPWARIVKVVDVLTHLKYEHVQFYGTKSPSRNVRRRVPLPKPH